MLINEAELRSQWHKTKTDVITVPRGSVLTPSARDFLRGNGIRVEVVGEGVQDLDRRPMSTAKKPASVAAAAN